MLIQLLTACFNLILLIEGGYLLTHRHRPLFNLHPNARPLPLLGGSVNHRGRNH